MASVYKVPYTSILDMKMLILANTILFNFFFQVTVATSFETIKNHYMQKRRKKRKKTPEISAQQPCLQNLPQSNAVILSDFLDVCYCIMMEIED